MESEYEQQIESLVKKLEDNESALDAEKCNVGELQSKMQIVSEQNESLMKQLGLRERESQSMSAEAGNTQKRMNELQQNVCLMYFVL